MLLTPESETCSRAVISTAPAWPVAVEMFEIDAPPVSANLPTFSRMSPARPSPNELAAIVPWSMVRLGVEREMLPASPATPVLAVIWLRKPLTSEIETGPPAVMVTAPPAPALSGMVPMTAPRNGQTPDVEDDVSRPPSGRGAGRDRSIVDDHVTGDTNVDAGTGAGGGPVRNRTDGGQLIDDQAPPDAPARARINERSLCDPDLAQRAEVRRIEFRAQRGTVEGDLTRGGWRQATRPMG